MRVVEFLNAISTPKVETKSLHQTLENYLSDKSKFNFKLKSPKKNLNDQYSEWNLKQQSNNTCLQMHSPFYTNKRSELNQQLKKRSKKVHKQSEKEQNSFHYLKKGIGYQSTWAFRRKLGKQKRQYLRDYERYTYKSSAPALFQESNELRKQFANAIINHKFCQFFSIKCGGCKCKLDCINKKFQQFLKNADLLILKNLSRIVGRGQNLGAIIKKQIMEILFSQTSKKDLQALVIKIKQKLSDLNLKLFEKKYIVWAKQMFTLLEKIENKQSKRKSNFKKNHIQEFKGQNFILISENKRKHRFLTKDQNKKVLINTSTQRKDQKCLSIRGSRISQTESIIKQNRDSKKSRNRSSTTKRQENDPFALIDAKFKSKRKKFQQTGTKKRTKMNTLFSRKESQSKSQFCAEHSLSIEKQINQFKEDIESSKIISISSELDQESRQKINQKVHFLEEIINKEVNHIQSSNQIKVPKFAPDQKKQDQSKPRTSILSIRNPKKIKSIHDTQLIKIRSKKKLQQTQKINRSKKKIKNQKNSINNASNFKQKEEKVDKKIQKTQVDYNNNQSEQLKEKYEQNLSQMRENIKENKGLVEKVEEQLMRIGMVDTIINKSDSYLTQKRKVKYIRQKLKRGALHRIANEVQKYFEILLGRHKLKSFVFREQTEQKKQKQTQKIEDINLSNQISQLLLKKRGLKFYNLTNIQKPNDPLQILERPQNIEPAIKKQKEKEKQKGYTGQFLYNLEAYVTQKQKIPFDFYHYLEMGKNYAKIKFVNQRGQAKREQYKHIFQKQLSKNQENNKICND